jgi:uncharacterized SAM-binding protein YcdF (DUF218 family)
MIRLIARLALALGAFATLGWSVGFMWFQAETQRLPPKPPPHVDGVVALTGGAGRIPAALRVLADGRADRLLITGIGGNADQADLARQAGMDLTKLAPKLTLGHYAASTRGNAVETAAWATQNAVHSLIVVTAAWHMPRALAELRLALPEVALYPLPVAPEEPDTRTAVQSLRVRAEEYTKYLLVMAGLSGLFPHRESGVVTRHEAVTATSGRG